MLPLFRIVPEDCGPYAPAMRKKNCKVCLVEHDESIHEATLSLHEWLRERIRHVGEEPRPEEIAPAA